MKSYYKHWLDLDLWYLSDAIRLIAEHEAISRNISKGIHFIREVNANKRKYELDVLSAYKSGELKLKEFNAIGSKLIDAEDGYEINIESMSREEIFVDKAVFVDWCKTIGIDLNEYANADKIPTVIGCGESAHEDIISEETIIKIKNLPLPQLKQQVAMLTDEKKKWDASIMAAAKISLLFAEEGFQKPATEDTFVAEYKNEFDKFPALPGTTIKRIYKNLPDGYRFSHNKAQPATEKIDITPIIKAAVYAGTIYDTDDVKILDKLKEELAEHEYELPSDDALKKIIEAVKDV